MVVTWNVMSDSRKKFDKKVRQSWLQGAQDILRQRVAGCCFLIKEKLLLESGL